MDDARPGTLAAQIALHARTAPDTPAILAPGRAALTFAGLVQQMSQTAEDLSRAGFGRRTRVALALHDGPEMAVALLSVMSCATCVPLDPDSDYDMLGELCERMRVEAIVIADDAPPALHAIARTLAIPTLLLCASDASPAGAFGLRCSSLRAPTSVRWAEPDDIALVLNTSGTTARAKLVPLTQRHHLESALHRAQCFGISSHDRALCVTPLFTASGIRRSLMPPLAVGGSVLCAPDRDPDRILQWLTEFEPTFVAASPTVYRGVLDAVERRGSAPRHALRFLISGAAGMPAELQLRLEERFGAPVIQAYAMTEVSGIAHNPLPPGDRRFGSAGLVHCGEVAILGDDGTFVESGNAGEIVVRGPQVFAGYEDDETANREAFFGDWFRTGDLGYMDADGYLYVTGRAKEIINRGGFKVSPSEVDALLLRHPAIADAATFGIRHPTLGEDVIAAVVLRDAASVTSRELRDFAFLGLAASKVPTRIVAVNRIPKTALGKVQRRELSHALVDLSRPAYVEPHDGRQQAVAALFAEVLGIDRVGAEDNFFSLGGDSLRATLVTTRVNARFACALAASTLFRRPTVVEFAQAIDETIAGGREFVAPPIVPLPRGDAARSAGEKGG